jgi:hypothetical protein
MKSRRKAISAELVRESKDNPGYFRYNIEIEEVDGKRHIVPAYGKDMQDAISRLVWNERVHTKLTSVIIGFVIFIPFLTACVLGALTDSPVWVLSGMGFSVVLGILMNVIDKYLSKS